MIKKQELIDKVALLQKRIDAVYIEKCNLYQTLQYEIAQYKKLKAEIRKLLKEQIKK